MIGGEKAFKAKSHASLVAAILEHEPPPLSTVHGAVPRRLNMSCGRSRQECRRSMADASDLHRELKWAPNHRTRRSFLNTTTRHPAARGSGQWHSRRCGRRVLAATIARRHRMGVDTDDTSGCTRVARLTI